MFSIPDINNFIKITTQDNQVLFEQKYPDTQDAAEVKFLFPRTQISKDNIVCFNLLSNTRFRMSIHPDSNDPRKLGVFLKSVKLSLYN